MGQNKIKSAKELSMEAVMLKTEEDRLENEEFGVLLAQAKQAVKEYREELEKVDKLKPVDIIPKAEELIPEGNEMLLEPQVQPSGLPEAPLPLTEEGI